MAFKTKFTIGCCVSLVGGAMLVTGNEIKNQNIAAVIGSLGVLVSFAGVLLICKSLISCLCCRNARDNDCDCKLDDASKCLDVACDSCFNARLT